MLLRGSPPRCRLLGPDPDEDHEEDGQHRDDITRSPAIVALRHDPSGGSSPSTVPVAPEVAGAPVPRSPSPRRWRFLLQEVPSTAATTRRATRMNHATLPLWAQRSSHTESAVSRRPARSRASGRPQRPPARSRQVSPRRRPGRDAGPTAPPAWVAASRRPVPQDGPRPEPSGRGR